MALVLGYPQAIMNQGDHTEAEIHDVTQDQEGGEEEDDDLAGGSFLARTHTVRYQAVKDEEDDGDREGSYGEGDDRHDDTIAPAVDAAPAGSDPATVGGAVVGDAGAGPGPAAGGSSSAPKKKRNVPTPAFLTKCFDIFSRPEHTEICCWGDKGDTILVHQPHRFAVEILPKYFKHANFQSFVRQLNMYNFTKTNPDPLVIEFRQAYFRRGRADLLPLIKRRNPTQGGLVAALARARRGAMPDHPALPPGPPGMRPPLPERQDPDADKPPLEPPSGGLAEALARGDSSALPAEVLAKAAGVKAEGGGGGEGGGAGAAGGEGGGGVLPASEALLHDLIYLLRWQKRMERRVKQLEFETQSLQGENTMLWTMTQTRATQQDDLQGKMKDVLMLMHRAFKAGQAVGRDGEDDDGDGEGPTGPTTGGGALTKTSTQLISDMKQMDFKGGRLAGQKRNAGNGGGGNQTEEETKRIKHTMAAQALTEMTNPQKGYNNYDDNIDDNNDDNTSHNNQVQHAEQQVLGRLDSLGAGLEHLLSFDQTDLSTLLRSDSLPGDLIQRYASLGNLGLTPQPSFGQDLMQQQVAAHQHAAAAAAAAAAQPHHSQQMLMAAAQHPQVTPGMLAGVMLAQQQQQQQQQRQGQGHGHGGGGPLQQGQRRPPPAYQLPPQHLQQQPRR